MMKTYKKHKKTLFLTIITLFSTYFAISNIYGNECLAFKQELLKTTLKGINKSSPDESYYAAMGTAIQRLHEEKKIDIMCRPFLLAELRKMIKGYSGKPTYQELYYYNIYSEYAPKLIEAEIQVGRTLFKEKIQYKDLNAFANKMHRSSQQAKVDRDSIPNILHHIWLTHPDNPKEIFSGDIQTVLKNKKLFSKDPVKWRHIVWTNDKSLIPNSMDYLEKEGIEVISINDYQDNIELFDLIMNLIDLKSYGAASDVLRYAILNHMGGVYADLNFLFDKGMYETLLKYDFLTQDMRNNFFASKPEHIILQKTLEKIYQIATNLNGYFGNQDFGTIQYTHHPFILAILKHANTNQNVDFYLDYYYFYGKTEEDPGPVGQDNYSSSGTWKRSDERICGL